MNTEKTSDSYSIPLEAFVRSISINSDTSHSLFIGAGASISSGVPSAERCILEWKQRIFTSANPGLEKQVSQISLPSVQKYIQSWFNKQSGFPALGASEEYSFYFENCYPLPEDRRAFFQSLVKSARPSYGYKLFSLLVEAGVFSAAWTTNFDGLLAKALHGSDITAIEVGLDTVDRIQRAPRKNELLCVSLHGDYRYDFLKNTQAELQKQDALLRDSLAQHMVERTVVVIGYSGRDKSVIECFKNALQRSGVGRFFWCGFQRAEPLPEIVDLIETARKNGRQAFYVSGNGFDDTMHRLALQCLSEGLADRAKQIIIDSDASKADKNIPFSLPVGQPTALVKSNCFPLDCPSEVYEFEVPDLRKEGTWAALRDSLREKRIVGGMLRGKVVAIGLLDEIKSAFGNRIQGEIKRSPIAEHELNYSNGVIIGVLRDAVVRSLAQMAGIETDGESLIWEGKPFKSMEVYKWKCEAYRAVVISLKRSKGRQYLVLMPTVFGKPQHGNKELPEFVEKELKRQILSTQYNKEFNLELEHWRGLLFPKGDSIVEYPLNTANSFQFGIRRTPAFAKIDTARPQKILDLPQKFLGLLQFEGTRLPEPKVVFATKDGNGYLSDAHPIRGLLSNRPFDYALTSRGLDVDIRVGIICPQSHSTPLTSFLGKLQHNVRANSKKGYLVDYPGFGHAFGLPLTLPQSIDPAWVECPDPQGSNNREKALSLIKNVLTCVDRIIASSDSRLVLVFIPDKWANYADFVDGEEEINLHDIVKAYCVQRGVGSQFLREKTLSKRFDCEVMWWLALSLYAKSMRTPWILDGLAASTAFVGVGFGVVKRKNDNRHIVLGCSHIYTSDGIGLNYRLSKIENPIYFQKNPHLSEEDAFKLGEDIRQLFFESRGGLPDRVVVHKRTQFLKAEKEGLLRGLKDVPVVDLVEINVEPSIRCTASVFDSNGFAPGGVPIDRGTAILFDRFKFLLWVNGNAHPNSSNEDYYMGRFRIPAPVMVKKHWGVTNVEQIALEILALSKMNWNTFDLYTRLPATIHSSNEIARIGKLLQRFEGKSYDYRLFI